MPENWARPAEKNPRIYYILISIPGILSMAPTFHPGVLVPQTLSLEQLHHKQPEKETPISKLHVLVKLNLHL